MSDEYIAIPILLPWAGPAGVRAWITREKADMLETWFRLPPGPPWCFGLPPDGYDRPPIDPCGYCGAAMHLFPPLKEPLDKPLGQICPKCRSTRPA